MILITSLLLFFGLFGDSTPEHIKLSQKVSSSYAKEVKEKRNLQYIGGGGALKNNVAKVSVNFYSNKQVTLDDARKLVVEMNEDLIQKYNDFLPIRPYLSNYPFEPKNIDVTIEFPTQKCNSDRKLVGLAGRVGDEILYLLYSSVTGERVEQFEENYLEAYKIVYGHERPK